MTAESVVRMSSGTPSQYHDIVWNSGFNPAVPFHNHVEYCTSHVSGITPAPSPESFSSVIDQSEADIFSAAMLTTLSDRITMSNSATTDASKATQHLITKEGLDHTIYQYCVPDEENTPNAGDYSRLSDYLIDTPDPGSIENADHDRVQIDFFRDDKVQAMENWARFDQPQADEYYLHNLPSDNLTSISGLALAATTDGQPSRPTPTVPEQLFTQPYLCPPDNSSINPITNILPSSPDPMEFMAAPDAYGVLEPTLFSAANDGDSVLYSNNTTTILKRNIGQAAFNSIEWPDVVVNRNDATQFNAVEMGMALDQHSCHANQISGGRRRRRYCSSSSSSTGSDTISHDQASISTPDGVPYNARGSPHAMSSPSHAQNGSMEADCGFCSVPNSMQVLEALPSSNQPNSLPGSAAADDQSKRPHMKLEDREDPPFKKTCRGMWGSHPYDGKLLYDHNRYAGNAKVKLRDEAEAEDNSSAALMLYDNMDINAADDVNGNSNKGNNYYIAINASSNNIDANDNDAPTSDTLEEDYNTANDTDLTLCAGRGNLNNPRRNAKARSKQGGASDPQSVAARHRRERISERLKILQELVPNGSKVALVTMLEKAINYVKFLQLQVKVLTTDEYWPNSQKLNEPKGANLLNLLMQQETPSCEFHKSFSKASAKSSKKTASSSSNTTIT